MRRRWSLGLVPFLIAAATTRLVQDDLNQARTRGRLDAPVTVYAMSDFQCPYCARFARETFPVLEREYVATGRVRFVFVNLPLPQHRNAVPAAELAMCAARQNRFWPVHDLLFRYQERWADLEQPGSFFLALGDSAGADRAALTECLRTGATRDLVRADAEGSARAGARRTPAFYIEGGLLEGAAPVETFRQVLDSVIRARAGR